MSTINTNEDDWQLLIQKAHDIIATDNTKSDHSDIEYLVHSFMTQNITKPYSMIIPWDVTLTIQSYLGPIHAIVADKMEPKMQQILNNSSLNATQWHLLEAKSSFTLVLLMNKKDELVEYSNEVKEDITALWDAEKLIQTELEEQQAELAIAKEKLSPISRKQILAIKALHEPPPLLNMVLNAVAELMALTSSTIYFDAESAIIQTNVHNVNYLFCGYVRLMSGLLKVDIPKTIINDIIEWTDPSSIVLQPVYCVKPVATNRYKCSWKSIQKMLRKFMLIRMMLRFDPSLIKENTRKRIEDVYLSKKEFNADKANKVSKVAGPMVLWVKAHVRFAALVNTVGSVERQVEALNRKQEKLKQMQINVERLKEKVTKEKHDYDQYVLFDELSKVAEEPENVFDSDDSTPFEF
eukprot:88977_1